METAGGGGGVLGLDGSFSGTQNGLFTPSSPSPLLALSSSSAAADDEGAEAAAARRRKWCSVNAGRSGGVFDEQSGSEFSIDDWRASKVAKTGHSSPPEFSNGGGGSGKKSSGSGGVPMKLTAAAAGAVNGGDGVYSDSCFQLQQQQNMLSFSKPEVVVTAPAYLPQMAAAATQSKSPGYHSGALNSASNLYLLSGIRGPFTPSQWLELEQQALIYKYITANQPIPSHLLIPIRKALESAGLYGFNCTQLKPSTWGWGPFHLGYSNSTDPEPGRCRRTDGKKWRCSRDAVQDQKYCERHMNRGRHRSRKLVEGQATGNVKNNDHSVQGTKLSSSAMKLATSSAVVVAGPDGSSSNGFDLARNFQSTSHPLVNRMLGNSVNGGPGMPDSATQISFLPPSSNLNTADNLLSTSRIQYPYNKESTPCHFGVPSNGSMFTSAATISHQNSFSGNYSSSSYEPAETRHSLHGIVNGWATTHAADHSSTFLWPGLHPKSETTTDLSVSLPLGGPADFMSSTSSPINEKATLSPLRLSRELDRTQMSLGVGLETNDHSQQGQEKQTNWIPISWETSMGGPLGEVLQSKSGNTNNSSVGEYKKTSSSSSPLNLLPKGWEYGGGSQPSSSPTGVLQSAFVSLSNSSAGSSPRADNSKAIESGGGGTAGGGNSLYNDLIIGPTLCHSSSSIPALD